MCTNINKAATSEAETSWNNNSHPCQREVFYLCQLRFSGADETVHEFFCGLSDSRFDLCSTIADFLQSATARVNAFSQKNS